MLAAPEYVPESQRQTVESLGFELYTLTVRINVKHCDLYKTFDYVHTA